MATRLQNPPADMTVADVKRFAKMYGLAVETHAPGDGKRRFQFVERDGHRVGFALGIREAEMWLRGYMAGVDFMTPPTRRRGSTHDENPRHLKDRHSAMTPKYQMEDWEYDHLRDWLASGRAPFRDSDDSTEVKRAASKIQAWLETMDKEDGVYLVEQGYPRVFDAYEAANGRL